MKLVEYTPIELHKTKSGREVLVKREDLSCLPPGPPFSKVRGLMEELSALKKSFGVEVVGYTETSVSMAGWGVAWGCSELGLKAVIFDPQYKATPPVLAYHRKQWAKFSPEIIPIQAGMAKVGWNISRKILKEKYGNSAVLLPLGLPFLSSVGATYREGILSRKEHPLVDRCSTVIVNVGSGTIAAGVLRAFPDKTIYGIMGRSGSIGNKEHSISKKSGIIIGGMFGSNFRLVDPGWEYTERSNVPCPFPCHPYYDRKAWQWLEENEKNLKDPIVFWNIGSMGRNAK